MYLYPLWAGLLLAIAGLLLGCLRLAAALRRRRLARSVAPLPLALIILGLVLTKGALRWKHATFDHAAIDTAMAFAFRPPRLATFGRWQILGGDLHCHVTPPDEEYHASRRLEDTIRLAKEEGLDFVGLTPHVWNGTLDDPTKRAEAVRAQRSLAAAVAAADSKGVLLIPGVEYTEDGYGHVGMTFGDLEAAAAATEVDARAGHPDRLFDAYVKTGGVLTINHPLLQPVDSVFRFARIDISWRPFTQPGWSYSPEITAADRLASNVEAYNLLNSEMRDRLLVGDRLFLIEKTFVEIDAQILRRQRRLTPFGGTDSHSQHLRPMFFVLAEERSKEALREGIVAGRVCVRSPEACTFEVRVPGGEWSPAGSSLRTKGPLEARAGGGPIVVLGNGEPLGRPGRGEVARMDVAPDQCTIVRAVVGEGWSAPVYVNCPFAGAGGHP